MITIGCAGFAVPATRYFKEYAFVEIQETALGTPGQGTLRRWKREAPEGFEFALLAPKEIAQEAFRSGRVVTDALGRLQEVAVELAATTAVFLAPPEFPASKPNRAALRDFLGLARERFATVVFDAGPGWAPDEADQLAEEAGALAARDPLVAGVSARPVSYYRLPGPAGRKSRYEDPAIERLAEIANANTEQQARYVFANVDMFTDAGRFRRLLS
ncbi:MAG: DUF72 domain-containing protein [Polyangiaceae bacterium]|nr:DUF72 domain-containing protein [Polyangiaceae bacterium]